MNIKLLEEFQALIKYGTLANASRVLSIDASSLGKDMLKLEALYAMKLFKEHRRGPHRLELTDEGRLLYQEAAPLLWQLHKLNQRMRDTKNGYSYVMPVTVAPALSRELLESFIIPFIKEVQPLRYDLMECSMLEQERRLLQGQAEFGYANSPIANPHLFKILKEIPTCYHVIYRKDSPYFEGNKPLELKALNNVPLCLAYSSAPRLLQLMDQEQLNAKVVCMNLHRANALIAATHGLGAAIFPLPATYEDAELISRPIASPLLKSRNVLYTLKDKELSQVSKLFLKYMLQKL